jgi:hypothetical protein
VVKREESELGNNEEAKRDDPNKKKKKKPTPYISIFDYDQHPLNVILCIVLIATLLIGIFSRRNMQHEFWQKESVITRVFQRFYTYRNVSNMAYLTMNEATELGDQKYIFVSTTYEEIRSISDIEEYFEYAWEKYLFNPTAIEGIQSYSTMLTDIYLVLALSERQNCTYPSEILCTSNNFTYNRTFSNKISLNDKFESSLVEKTAYPIKGMYSTYNKKLRYLNFDNDTEKLINTEYNLKDITLLLKGNCISGRSGAKDNADDVIGEENMYNTCSDKTAAKIRSDFNESIRAVQIAFSHYSYSLDLAINSGILFEFTPMGSIFGSVVSTEVFKLNHYEGRGGLLINDIIKFLASLCLIGFLAIVAIKFKKYERLISMQFFMRFILEVSITGLVFAHFVLCCYMSMKSKKALLNEAPSNEKYFKLRKLGACNYAANIIEGILVILIFYRSMKILKVFNHIMFFYKFISKVFVLSDNITADTLLHCGNTFPSRICLYPLFTLGPLY